MRRYTDSPDGDWMIGYYPSDSGLLLATSGSGHAYKERYWVSRFAFFSLTLHCSSCPSLDVSLRTPSKGR
jgi:hypothetical protein